MRPTNCLLQVALQRMAEQEREVSKLAEQNKAQYLQQQQGMYNMYLPYGYTQPGMPAMHAMPPQPGLMSPPQHGMMANMYCLHLHGMRRSRALQAHVNNIRTP